MRRIRKINLVFTSDHKHGPPSWCYAVRLHVNVATYSPWARDRPRFQIRFFGLVADTRKSEIEVEIVPGTAVLIYPLHSIAFDHHQAD